MKRLNRKSSDLDILLSPAIPADSNLKIPKEIVAEDSEL